MSLPEFQTIAKGDLDPSLGKKVDALVTEFEKGRNTPSARKKLLANLLELEPRIIWMVETQRENKDKVIVTGMYSEV